MLISSKDVLVGDIETLEPGEILPCDGILVSGYRIRCDESSVWGESDPIRKHTFDESHGQYDGEKPRDCFVLSGSKVLEGVGRYVVVAVGERSFNGRILMGTDFINPISFQG
jgi:P-type Ca2+ transporter type 2C